MKNHIQKLKLSLSGTNLCPNDRLVPLWILNYRESAVVAPIS